MAKRWYSVSVLSNFEKKIAEQIRTSVSDQGLEDEIDEVLVPTEEVIEVRRGKKVTTEYTYDFEKKANAATMVFKVWSDMETVNIPFEVEVGLGM